MGEKMNTCDSEQLEQRERLERWRRTITESADAMVKYGTNDAAILGFMRRTAAYIAEEPKRERAKERQRQLYREHCDRKRRKEPLEK